MDRRQGSRQFPGWSAVFSMGQGSGNPFLADIALPQGTTGFAVARGDHRPPSPVRCSWAMGSGKPGPIVWTRRLAPLLVSQGVVEILRRRELTGWDTLPLELHGKDGHPIPGYQGLVIRGRCGPIDDGRSVQVPKQYPAGVFPVWKGLYFDEASWDGSDLFMPAGSSGWMMAVDRVVQVFRESRLPGVEFTPLDQVERARL